ncbi:hypothetical protein [Bizionia argentinensis]|uniref:hypothetical protein n=1 Tax=Bizionia argentinensis TaxID=456455 RepID=UPI0002232B02|nr:hypothetical protein [Bizionia argentinensis]
MKIIEDLKVKTPFIHGITLSCAYVYFPLITQMLADFFASMTKNGFTNLGIIIND